MELNALAVALPAMMLVLGVAWPLGRELQAEYKKERETARRAEERGSYKRRHLPVLGHPPSPVRKGSPPVATQLPMTAPLFSEPSALTSWEVLLDGDCVQGAFTFALTDEYGQIPCTIGELEAIASKRPHQEWLVKLTAPLQSLLYQRHAPGEWNLVGADEGLFS